LIERCEAAALAGARLIVTPEMGTTGYCWFDRAEVVAVRRNDSRPDHGSLHGARAET
jgi:predicted amidohydrolase